MLENKFLLDIFAAKEYGIEKWHRDFFWPVSEQEFLRLFRDIELCLAKQVNAQPDDIGKLIVMQYELRVEYANFMHALMVTQRLKSKGMQAVYSALSLWYKSILENNPIDTHVSSLRAASSGLKGMLKASLKTAVYSCRENKNILKYFTSLFRPEVTKVYGSDNYLMKHYLKKIPGWLYFTSKEHWFTADSSYKIPADLKTDIKKLSKTVACELKAVAENHGFSLEDRHVAHLINFTEKELESTATVFHLIRKKIKKSARKTHLVIAGTGNTFERALSIAVKECGGRVTTFIHGGDIGFRNVSISLDMATADNFVVYTPGSERLFKRIKRNPYLSNNDKINIQSGDSDEYLKLWREFSNKALPKEIKRVMIMGYPHNQWRRILYVGGFSLVRLDLELRLVNFLKDRGYEVLYKAHPDRLKEIEGIFENNAKILREDFQECLDEADLFIFPTTTTQTFQMALCTGKPIIILDLSFKLKDPFPEAIELLKKRCSIVRTEFDERNRILFDENCLLEALRKNITAPNNEFVEKYMFP